MVNPYALGWHSPRLGPQFAENDPIRLIDEKRDEILLIGMSGKAGNYIGRIFHAVLIYRGDPVDFVYGRLSLKPDADNNFQERKWEDSQRAELRHKARSILIENVLRSLTNVVTKELHAALPESLDPYTRPAISYVKVDDRIRILDDDATKVMPYISPPEKTGIAGVANEAEEEPEEGKE